MNLNNLESIEIGNECFGSVQTFQIEGLNRLKSLKIGINSFTQVKQSEWNSLEYNDRVERCKQSKSFHILNCESLESIEIGEYSFSDYGSDFELRNLSQLQSIQIGTIAGISFNFYCSSFVIRDLPNLQSITLGDSAFSASLSTIIENLPSLQSITIGVYALNGRDDNDSCSLIMRNLPILKSINSRGDSFNNARLVTLENIPNLQNVNLHDSFQIVVYPIVNNWCICT